MSWFCSVCEKSFSRKDSMQRHVMSKHRNAGLTPFQTVPIFSQKCQRFYFEHPFTSMISGVTGSGKMAWVRSLLQQVSETIYPPPERIVWCYSQLTTPENTTTYHNALCLSPKILHKRCFQFLLGVKMAPRDTENNAYAKFWGDKQRALWYVMVFLEWSIMCLRV